METLTILPVLEGRRFGSLALGYDRIETIRSEMGALTQAISTLLGIPVESVTVRGVQEKVAELQGRAAAFDSVTVDEHVEYYGVDADDDLLALALACRNQLTSAKR